MAAQTASSSSSSSSPSSSPATSPPSSSAVSKVDPDATDSDNDYEKQLSLKCADCGKASPDVHSACFALDITGQPVEESRDLCVKCLIATHIAGCRGCLYDGLRQRMPALYHVRDDTVWCADCFDLTARLMSMKECYSFSGQLRKDELEILLAEKTPDAKLTAAAFELWKNPKQWEVDAVKYMANRTCPTYGDYYLRVIKPAKEKRTKQAATKNLKRKTRYHYVSRESMENSRKRFAQTVTVTSGKQDKNTATTTTTTSTSSKSSSN